jgi:hypothetical protein
LSFINGGFEQGLDGWRKYGGELHLVGQPTYAGASAGELYSTTDSTKWAYQTVRIDASQSYEFSGYVQGGPGMSKAYLRVSWYASSDGSGQALSTSDSTSALETTGEFVYLTTGSVTPPPGAQSAKPRVMFTPRGSAPASIRFDEIAFAIAAPSSPTPATAAGPKSTSEAATTGRVAQAPISPADTDSAVDQPDEEAEPEHWDPEPTGTPIEEVRAVVADAGPPDDAGSLPLTRPAADDGVPVIWLVAGALFAAGLGGSYLAGRKRQ